jgi:hypothetical protein
MEGVDPLSAEAVFAIRDTTFNPIARLIEREYELSPRGFVLAPSAAFDGSVDLSYSDQSPNGTETTITVTMGQDSNGNPDPADVQQITTTTERPGHDLAGAAYEMTTIATMNQDGAEILEASSPADGGLIEGTFEDTDTIDEGALLSDENFPVLDLDQWNGPDEHGAMSVVAADKVRDEIVQVAHDLFP